MAITDQKIGAWTSPVVNEADQPQRTAADMKAVFDSNSNQIKAKYNALIDALAGTGGADNIGSAAIGDLQAGTVATQLSALLAKFAGYPASSDIKGIRLNSEGRIEVTLDGTQWQLTAQTGDPALDLGALETAQTIDDADGFLMYDASEMKNKRTLWSKIKSVLGSGYALATHAHGSITNDGKIGTAANKAVYTGDGGALQAGTLPVSAGGTGATTSAGALANLGAQAEPNKVSYTTGAAEITFADNTEYTITSGVSSVTFVDPGGEYECWINMNLSDNSALVFMPQNYSYIGSEPAFENNKSYEISVKNGVFVVGEITSVTGGGGSVEPV